MIEPFDKFSLGEKACFYKRKAVSVGKSSIKECLQKK